MGRRAENSTYKVSITINKHQHERIALLGSLLASSSGRVLVPKASYLTTSLLLVFVATFFHFLIVTFEGAVVL